MNKTFLDKLEYQDILEIYPTVLTEMFEDAKVLLMEEDDLDELLYESSHFIGKYSFAIYLLEEKEEYEKCQELYNIITEVILEYSPLCSEDLKISIDAAITLYKLQLNNNNYNENYYYEEDEDEDDY